ncbi:HNH endonuclease signature motif containing protein [Fodinicola acaciae]|uniref:HNH endonuclease signature motif containing protein n=1 Tax=Fodinicola acaciae TaxID=2681555 RepID=UPI0013D5C6A5|nr:HNH endonuclease signature motif containing protein [Fodinicola acaciae]
MIEQTEIIDADDGMAWLSALLPAEKTEAIYQLIADVLADRILGDPSNVKIRLDVKVNATTMMGLDNEPGQIVGHGPITAKHAREPGMRPGSEWFRLWTDGPTDTVLDYGRLKYKPDTALADYVRANAPTCIFPCCNRPARSCEPDHTVPFPDGPTSADNLKPLCKYHHEAKTHHGWDVTQVTYAWTSPLGRTYVVSTEDN